jgi:hypothetical protein
MRDLRLANACIKPQLCVPHSALSVLYVPMAKCSRARASIKVPADPLQLTLRRVEIETHLVALLEQTGSGATVQQFKKSIYEKGSVISFVDLASAAFGQFPTRRRDVDIDTRLPVRTDAWNYFPHRARGGKCPAELEFR